MSILTKKQCKHYEKSGVIIDGEKVDIIAKVRYDDQCNNGHNSFAISGEYYYHNKRKTDRNMISCGCVHEAIEQALPELAHLIKWHLCSSDGPMHYLENTTYHARDTDHNGLKKGEYSAYIQKVISSDVKKNAEPVILYTSGTMYTNNKNNANLTKLNKKEADKLAYFMSELEPEINASIITEYCDWSKSEGKEINIEAAKRCAIWPDATLEQLQDKDALNARLPALMAEFKADIESLGFTY